MKLISKYKCNAMISFRTIASKYEYNAIASFQCNTMASYWYTVGKTRDKYCFGYLYVEMQLNFWNPRITKRGIFSNSRRDRKKSQH